MKKWLKGLLVVFTILILATSAVSADVAGGNIQANLNSTKIKVNGTLVGIDNILYEDTLYVPLRIISQIYDKNISWDASTRTVNITDNTKTAAQPEGSWKSIAYLLALAFMFSGLLLLIQAGFLRSKRNIKQLTKLSQQQNNGANPGIKRLLQEKWTVTYGFYYLAAGVALQFIHSAFTYTVIKCLFVVFVTLVLWLVGIWLAKSKTENQYCEIVNVCTENTSKEEILAKLYTR